METEAYETGQHKTYLGEKQEMAHEVDSAGKGQDLMAG
jgi:hypothetical protein